MENNETRDSRACILVVDDDDLVREMICEFLRLFDYDVVEARDGPCALEIAKNSAAPIAAVVSDYDMPAMNGVELWERIKPFVSPNCRVIFISGRAFMLNGVALPGELLAKPLSLFLLKEKLSSILNLRPC